MYMSANEDNGIGWKWCEISKLWKSDGVMHSLLHVKCCCSMQ